MRTNSDRTQVRTFVLRSLECLLLVAGVASLLYCTSAGLQARAAEHAANAFVLHSGPAAPGPASPTSAAPASTTAAATSTSISDVIGKIRIPRLNLSAPITTGIGKTELIEGVGHIPGTAMPGGLGTVGLAGHRDTFFRPLRNIQKGMIIRVTGADGTFRYQVDSTRVVTPEQVEVLETGTEPRLILVTCYPFYYIGAAPNRFIVQAHLVSLIPDAREP